MNSEVPSSWQSRRQWLKIHAISVVVIAAVLAAIVWMSLFFAPFSLEP